MRVSGLARESQRFSFGGWVVGPMISRSPWDVGGVASGSVCGFGCFFFVKSMDEFPF